MLNEFELAINQICDEKGIPKEQVQEAMEAAIAAAYKKDYGDKGQVIEAEFDLKTGQTRLYQVEEVIDDKEEIEKPKQQLLLKDAKKIEKDTKVGDEIKTEVTPSEISFGRIAAQTAKQVITQKIREAEKDNIYKTYKEKEGELVNGVVQRIEKQTIFIDLGYVSGILPPFEQIKNERYKIGQRVKVYIKEVKKTPRGSEIILSRAEAEIVKKLFELEVPEVDAGTVEIKSLTREAGSRTKIAVKSTKDEIDPIGACVGQRGTRVQTIIAELGGEKIDIIEWDDNPVRFITNALAPAKIISVKLNEKDKHAIVEVAEDQLSLAIGKEGQNVRLAVKLTGWKIDIAKDEKKEEKDTKDKKGDKKEGDKKEDKVKSEEKDNKKEEKIKDTKKDLKKEKKEVKKDKDSKKEGKKKESKKEKKKEVKGKDKTKKDKK
jgi:transcription termination/antitermination protein NusA